MKWLWTALILFQFGNAYAAGPFDGAWSGKLSGYSRTGGPSPICSGSLTATVTDGTVEGTLVTVGNRPAPFAGTIDPNGRYQSSRGMISGKFAKDSFNGIFVDTSICVWSVSMNHS